MKLELIWKSVILKIHQNEKWALMLIFCVLGGITFWTSSQRNTIEVVQQDDRPELDELIPPGLVLLPVELTNREALAAIVGRTAVVDLLQVDPQTLSPQTKVASRVKLIRSPRNPDFFSLLVEENIYSEILKRPGPYFALVQSRRQRNSQVSKTVNSPKIEIRYQE
jgi:hypothetical protein